MLLCLYPPPLNYFQTVFQVILIYRKHLYHQLFITISTYIKSIDLNQCIPKLSIFTTSCHPLFYFVLSWITNFGVTFLSHHIPISFFCMYVSSRIFPKTTFPTQIIIKCTYYLVILTWLSLQFTYFVLSLISNRKDIKHFHYMNNKAMHMNPWPEICHEIYYFGRQFLGYQIYMLCL